LFNDCEKDFPINVAKFKLFHHNLPFNSFLRVAIMGMASDKSLAVAAIQIERCLEIFSIF
jgi:hypothetical protein